MSWEFHPAQTAFSQYAADWDRLNSELYASHPYYDSRFVGALLKYFASGEELLCLYRQESGIHGALIIQSRGLGCWSSFQPAQAQITPLLIADALLIKQLIEVIPGFFWSIDFYAIDPCFAPVFSSARADSITSASVTTIGIDPRIGFEMYWSQRNKKLRSNLRRYTARVVREEGAAAIEISCVDSPQAMQDGIRRFGYLESAGWKAGAGTAVSADNVQGRFYAEVLSSFAKTGQAKIFELILFEKVAASRLILGNEQMEIMLKTAYDESLAHLAPGRILLYQVLERLMTDQPKRSIEFYTNATRDQAEWATFSHEILNIRIFRSDVSVAVFSLAQSFKRRLTGHSKAGQSIDNAQPTLEIHSFTSVENLDAGNKVLKHFAPRDSIEASIEWFDLLQKQVYPEDPGVRYYVASEQERPVAILPIRETRQGWVRTLESLSNYYTSLYSPLVNDERDSLVLGSLLSATTRENCSAHVLRFAPMDPESRTYTEILKQLRATGWIPLTFFCFGNWFLKVEGGWEDYLRKRSANLRSSLKRMSKKFAADSGILEIISDSTELERGIAAFQEVYLASWKNPEPYPDFVPSLIRLLARKGMLRLGIARIQDKPIAAQLWIAGQGKASIYKVAYHEAYSSYSPGTVLTGYLMQHVIEHDQVTEVDFLIGDDKYKQIWMSHRRERWGIIAFNTGTLIGNALLMKEIAGRVAKAFGRKFSAILTNAKNRISILGNQNFTQSDSQHVHTAKQKEKL